MVLTATLAPLRHRDFRLFWAGQWISRWGDNLFLVAQTWVIWQMTGSGAAMATLVIFGQIPSALLLLVGGALVDRMERRWLSIGSDLIRGALMLLAAGLYAAGLLRPLHLYLLAGAFGLVSAVARPAFQALVQTLAPAEERLAANSLVQGGGLAASVGGPALGGLVLGLGGPALALLLNGVSFLVAAVAMLPTRPPEPVRPPGLARDSVAAARGQSRPHLNTLIADQKEAFRLLAGHRFLLATILFMAIINIISQAPVILLRPWVASRAGGGPLTLSMAYSAFAAGMALTLAFLSGVTPGRKRGVLIYAGLVATGLIQAAMVLVAAPWQLWVLELGLGASVMFHGVIWPVLLQESTPPEAMGRVSALDEFGRVVLYPAGVGLVGLAIHWPGSAAVMLGSGLLTAGVATLGAFLALRWAI